MSESIPQDQSIWDRLRQQWETLDADQHQKSRKQLTDRLELRAKQLRQRVGTATPAGNRLSILTFHHGAHRYGVLVSDVLEIQPLHSLTPVPGTPPFLPAVIHWRGSVLALLDLSKLFELPETGIADLHVAIIVESAGVRIALLGGQVEDLISVPETDIQPIPDLPGGVPEEWVIGVQDENRLLLRMSAILKDRKLLDWRG